MRTLLDTSLDEAKEEIILNYDMGSGNMRSHSIPIAALASWSELLGIDDPGEVLDAIIHVAENGEPEPDPVTGENVWTASFYALQDREQARAATTYQAQDEGRANDPRSPRLRAAFSALAVEDQVVIAQATARSRLGLPEPGQQARMAGRSLPTPLDEVKTQLVGDPTLIEAIEESRANFLSSLRPLIVE